MKSPIGRRLEKLEAAMLEMRSVRKVHLVGKEDGESYREAIIRAGLDPDDDGGDFIFLVSLRKDS